MGEVFLHVDFPCDTVLPCTLLYSCSTRSKHDTKAQVGLDWRIYRLHLFMCWQREWQHSTIRECHCLFAQASVCITCWKKTNKQPAVLVGLHVNRSSVWEARCITEECDTEKQWSVSKLQVGPTPLWTRVSTVLCNRPVSRYDICNWLITICEVLTWLWSVYAYFHISCVVTLLLSYCCL